MALSFWEQTKHVNWPLIFAGVVLTFTPPMHLVRRDAERSSSSRFSKTTSARLMAPQFYRICGFAPCWGGPVKWCVPYVIARKENLTFASQAAVWTVERIFDMGAFAALAGAQPAIAPI